jgi:hypothetical protein
MTNPTKADNANIQSRAPGRQPGVLSSIAASVLAISAASSMTCSAAFAAEPNPDETAHVQWRDTMIKMETPHVGCFQAAFPSTLWEEVPCHAPSIHAHPLPRRGKPGESLTTGNGNDYALVAGGLISQTVGSFPAVSYVATEYSAGVPAFGNQGVLGPNEYTLQINTNANLTTSACSGATDNCTVWQQFVYATDYATPGSAAVFMEYWLIGWGPNCPSGYNTSGIDCWKNGPYATAPDVPISSLGGLKMTGTTVPGGNDSVTFANGTAAYSVSALDSVLQIGTVWEQSEFNVVGDAGGSEAIFNGGASVTVNVAAQFGSTAAPGCASNAGTTGETNNLNLGSCTTAGGTTPSIQFTESTPFYTDVITLTEGVFGNRQSQGYGFFLGEFGSVSPTTTSTGLTYRYIEDLVSTGQPRSAYFGIQGLTGDPSNGWLQSLTCLGVEKTGASAAYGYSSGIADWIWTNYFGFGASGTTQCTIVHE